MGHHQETRWDMIRSGTSTDCRSRSAGNMVASSCRHGSRASLYAERLAKLSMIAAFSVD